MSIERRTVSNPSSRSRAVFFRLYHDAQRNLIGRPLSANLQSSCAGSSYNAVLTAVLWLAGLYLVCGRPVVFLHGSPVVHLGVLLDLRERPPVNHPSIPLFIHSFTHHSFIQPFVHSLTTHSFNHSFIRSFTHHSSIHSFIHSLNHSSIHSFLQSFIHLPLIHSILHSFFHPLTTHPSTHSFVRLSRPKTKEADKLHKWECSFRMRLQDQLPSGQCIATVILCL